MKKSLFLLLTVMVCGISMAQPKDDDDKYAVELLKPGTQAPDLCWKTAEGKDFKLSELRGQYVVLDFWASWCPDCRKDAPNMKRMYEQFRHQGVAFVGVSFDTDAELWKKAVAKYELNYTQVCELKRMRESQTAQEFGVKWIPSMYLIDPNGKVVFGTVLSYKIERALYEMTDKHYVPSIDSLVIDGSKGKLAAVIQKPAMKTGEKCPMVMLCHGFTGNKESKLLTLLADSLQANGIASIRFDFNGHGKSEGRKQHMTIEKEITDAKAILDYVQGLPYVSEVGLLGHSQGGVIASMTAGRLASESKMPAGVVLIAPGSVIKEACQGGKFFNARFDPKDPPEYIRCWGIYKLGREYLVTTQQLDIFGTSAAYDGPVLLLHGDRDGIVPMWCSEQYLKTYGSHATLKVVEGENHTITRRRKQVIAETVTFFKKVFMD